MIKNLHMTEHEWAQYIQDYKPKTESEIKEFMKVLFEYSTIGNIEAQVAEVRALGIGRGFDWVKETNNYKSIIRNAKNEQYQVRKGFFSK